MRRGERLETIIDNQKKHQLHAVLNDKFTQIERMSLVTNFFTLYAYEELKSQLKDCQLDLILTKPLFQERKTAELLQLEANLGVYQPELEAQLNLNRHQLALQFGEWLKKKAQIRAPKKKVLNLGMAHIQGSDTQATFQQLPELSLASLGKVESDQRYLMTMSDKPELGTQFLNEFQRFWDNTELLVDVKAEVLKQLEIMARENEPELLYFFTLSQLFQQFVESTRQESLLQETTGFTKTIVWDKLYDFQRDGVIGAINKIETYNGCILADSVGLGKTFEALAVIKFYELRNQKVLVLAPKKLRENWTMYRNNDTRNILANDRFSYDVLNHTDLSRDKGKSGDIELATVNWGNYDLVVIDESHNFRNRKYKEEGQTRYQKLLEDVMKKGVKTKVLLLSATPVNNELKDLKNQLDLITEEQDDLLRENGIESIQATINAAQRAVNRWGQLPEDVRTTTKLLDEIGMDYFQLLDSFTIARSRKHIEKYYDIKKIGHFPIRLAPINEKPAIDILDIVPSMEDVNTEILRLNLAIYTLSKYVYPKFMPFYEKKVNGGLSRSGREYGMVHLMKTSLLKRMESSVHSFQLTLGKMLQKTNDFIALLEAHQEQSVNLSVDSIFDFEDDETAAQFIGNNKAQVSLQHVDPKKWLSDLYADQEILQQLYETISQVTPDLDNKLDLLQKQVCEKIQNPINQQNKKIIIFTAFADTAHYLYNHLHTYLLDNYGVHTAVVTGSQKPKSTLKVNNNRNLDFLQILMYFSPRSKDLAMIVEEAHPEIDILIATDCISEGQNLQDCDYLINYDIHWNPVRIIQRFGRIDRLGSQNKYIQLVNYWPPIELDAYINLESRVRDRMETLDISATGEENVISSKGAEMQDLEYRRKQLEQLQTSILDIEDVNGSMSLTDFTLDDFRMDLLNLESQYPQLSPLHQGTFSVVQNQKAELADVIPPGMLLCFRHSGEKGESDNPIYPYYLVYVNEAGEIVYTSKQAKKILDAYRSLSLDKRTVDTQAYATFNQLWKQKANRELYQNLVQKALDHCRNREQEEAVQQTFSFDFFSFENAVSDYEDGSFELLSYLIILGGDLQ